MNDLIIDHSSSDAATPLQVDTSATLHNPRNDSRVGPAIPTASSDYQTFKSLGDDDGTTHTASAGPASSASAETNSADLESDASAGITALANNEQNLVLAIATADDTSAVTSNNPPGTACWASDYPEATDTSLLAVVEFVGDNSDSPHTSARVAITANIVPEIGFTAAVNSADTAGPVASAAAYS